MKRDYRLYYKRFQLWTERPATKISGLVSLTFLTIAFFGLLAILPTLKTIGGLKKEVEDSQNVNSQLAKKILALQTAEDNYAKITPNLSLLNNVLPEKDDFEKLSWQIQWLAQQSGVVLSSGTFGGFVLVGKEPTASKDVTKLNLDIAVAGNYQQIKTFIKRLTAFNRLITIEEVTVNSKTAKQTKNLTANLRLTAYSLLTGAQ